jgi:hypothetical protein
VRTVESHPANLMAKVNVHSQVELVRYAANHGLLDPENKLTRRGHGLQRPLRSLRVAHSTLPRSFPPDPPRKVTWNPRLRDRPFGLYA